MTEERRFKLLTHPPEKPETIPWSLAEEAWQGYAKAGHGDQSLKRIAERGGFGRQEVACALQGHYNQCSRTHTDCMRKLDIRLIRLEKNRPEGPWWDDFEHERPGDSFEVSWSRSYAGLFATGEPVSNTQQSSHLAKAFLAMAKRVDVVEAAGAALLRTLYESGIAYDNPEVEAALAVFAAKAPATQNKEIPRAR